MELARPLAAEQPAQTSPLTTLRLQRKLTIEEAAKRAALWPEQVEWLEGGKLYRSQRHDTAVLALLRYATSLGIDHREARRLSGMPVEPPARRPVGRWIAAGAAPPPPLPPPPVPATGLRGRPRRPAAAQ